MKVLPKLLALAVVFVLVFGLVAAEDKVLKGNITCAKCELKKEAKCTTVVVVKEGGKDVVYYFDEKAGKKYHKEICTEGKQGTVTGEVSEKDGKKVVTVSKVEFK